MGNQRTGDYNRAVRAELVDLSESVLANLFARHNSGVLRYCPGRKTWLRFDGKRWRRDDGSTGRRLAIETLGYIDALIDAVEDPEDRARIAERRRRCGFHRAIKSMLRIAGSQPGMVAGPEVFDRRPHLLTCLNGTVDLTTGILRPHRADDHLTHLMAIEYQPDPSLPPEAGLRRWCRRLGMDADACRTISGFAGVVRPPEFDPGEGHHGPNCGCRHGRPGNPTATSRRRRQKP